MRHVALIAALAIGCGGKPAAKSTTPAAHAGGEATASTKTSANAELYERLGGQGAIVAVVDEFIARVAADDRINLRFINTDIPRLKSLLVEFVCMATGGPCKYSGQDMETSHAGMEIVDEEFDALVEDLTGALDKFHVPAKEKGELLGALGPLKPRVVIAKERLHPVSDALVAKATAVLPRVTDDNA
jgi:hemoglobin